MDGDEQPCPLPSPSIYPRPPSSSLLLKDISNFKTPKRPSQPPNFQSPCSQKYFTASKNTPKSSASLYRPAPPSARSKSTKTKTAAARRLKSLELEQSKSAYKSKLKKEQSLKSLSKSLTVWVNFLLQNPKSCGCDRFDSSNVGTTVVGKGKREGGEVMTWRNPKRQRDAWWRGDNDEVESEAAVSESKYLTLRKSLNDVCSLEDLKQRMRMYMSSACCKEIFDIMSRVTKNIDEGRLKMKSHCPIVTDFGMKEKATNILLCYNPDWLRIGLYIIFGGDSLMLDEDVNTDQEMAFLKIMIEKQFFTHARLAKAFAYNKKVEGLYRPGYYETLGNVILKRVLLLVLILDRAKSQSSLPLKYGIDGVDGGSPLLFSVQSSIKSSRQVIVDFLSSEVMHGEGNLFAHLMVVGYKVSYLQCPLLEYDFRVTNLFVDLQDGVRLGRIVQLLLQDSSILTKMVVPSDTHKKNLVNCGIALQYLRQAGVKLFDEDGTAIMEDDVANGDKELILSLLWNMFVHLQLPLLINRKLLIEEICKICGTSMDNLNSVDSGLSDLLLNWIQVICEKYDVPINNFSSLTDGKAIWCLLEFYFRKELCGSGSSKNLLEAKGEESIVSTTDYTDAFHNFILSQKLTTLLGNFPEVLQMSDILEHNGACSDRSVVILLVFLSSQLIVRKNMDQLNFHKLLGCNCQSSERRRSNIDSRIVNSEVLPDQEENGHDTEDVVRKFKALQAWWQQMAEQNCKNASKHLSSTLQTFSTSKSNVNIERGNAAKVIQFHFRRWIERRNFLKMRNAVSFLQTVIRAWLAVKHNSVLNTSNTRKEKRKQCEQFGRYVKFIVERHSFVQLRSVLLIQRAARIWIDHRQQVGSIVCHGASTPDLLSGAIAADDQKCLHSFAEIDKASVMCQENSDTSMELEAALKIQFAWRNFIASRSLQKNCFAATKIQSHFRSWFLRTRFLNQKQATLRIQNHFRYLRCLRAFQQYKAATRSAIIIQSYVRGWIARRGAWRLRYIIIASRSLQKNCTAATKIQSRFRSWLLRTRFLNQRQATLRIQNHFRYSRCLRAFQQYKAATRSAIIVQSYVRGWIARRGAWRLRYLIVVIQRHFRGQLIRRDFLLQREAAIKIQSAVRFLNCWRAFHFQKYAAIEVQRFVRGQIIRSRLLGSSHYRTATHSGNNLNTLSSCFRSFEVGIVLSSVVKLQRWWKNVLLQKLRTTSAIVIQSNVRGWIARRRAWRLRYLIVVIQRHFRGQLTRRDFLLQREAAIKIQSAVRFLNCWRAFHFQKHAATEVQRFVRGQITRRRLLGSSQYLTASPSDSNFNTSRSCFRNFELRIVLSSVVKLQSWWRNVLLQKLRTTSAIIIQSHIRGWAARRMAYGEKHGIVVIQSYWRGYLVRKASSFQLLDLRLRVQMSATNVDDGMHIINRLVSALSELLRMKSVSGILRICTTLDMATQHSQKCCEKLVAAGAVDTLLNLIRSVSRSIPDQQVLKHALSALRNIAHYPHLIEVLIDSQGSVETILWELLRNKDEGYFIAADILKNICSTHKGVEAICKLPAHLKRLNTLVDELTRKQNLEKRNARNSAVRDNLERRQREAAELLKLIKMLMLA